MPALSMTTLFAVLRIIVIVIIFIVAISLLQFIVSIHPPKYNFPETPAQFNLKYEDISFETSDKITIKAWLIESKKANSTVIIGHGYPFNKGNILPVVKFLYPDYNLLLYDHRYFGESSGKMSTVGLKEVEDVKAAVNFVKKRFKNKKIALYGFSLSASAMLMSKTDVNAIISDSAYANLELMVKQVYKLFGVLRFPFVFVTNILSRIFLGVHPKDISPALAIKDSKTPIFVIHGDRDTQINVKNAYLLNESNHNIEMWIVKGADHGMVYALHRDEYENRIKDFLKENMK